jgi:hypothetical protein
MHLDRHDVLLTSAGIIASAGIAFVLYRLEKQNAANAVAAAQSSTDALQAQVSQIASQQYPTAPGAITVPTISNSPSPIDTTATQTVAANGATPATDINLANIIASFQAQDSSHITSQSTPIASIPELPLPTATVIPTVVVPTVQTFAGYSAPGTSIGTSLHAPLVTRVGY